MVTHCKTYVRNLVSQCLLSEGAFGVQTNEVNITIRLVLQGQMKQCSHFTDSAANKFNVIGLGETSCLQRH